VATDVTENAAAAQAEVKTPAPKPPKESKYPVNELIASHAVFKVPYEVVCVALRSAGKSEYSESEARDVIKKFMERKVN